MKLNLPSTWTSQKMSALFLLTMLNSLPVKAGSQFMECLGIDLYNSVSNFATNIVDKQVFCCGGSNGCQLATRSIDCRFITGVQCNKIGQSKFCVTKGSSFSKSTLPGHLCGGTLGDAPITNVAVDGICPTNLEVVNSTLNSQSTAPNFSWLCCDNNACSVTPNVVIKDRTAYTNCAFGQHSMMCFNDNGGWSCAGNSSANFNDVTLPIGTCILQIESPTGVSPSGISSLSSTKRFLNPTNLPNNANNDSNKNQGGINPTTIIAIAVPTGVLLIATTTAALYYRHKLKKNREQQNNISLQPIDAQQQDETLAFQGEQPYQAQIQVNPYYVTK